MNRTYGQGRQRDRGTRIGYLRQEAVDACAGRDNTVDDEARTADWGGFFVAAGVLKCAMMMV